MLQVSCLVRKVGDVKLVSVMTVLLMPCRMVERQHRGGGGGGGGFPVCR